MFRRFALTGGGWELTGGGGAGGPWAMRDCLHTARSHHANGRRRGSLGALMACRSPMFGRPLSAERPMRGAGPER